MVYIRYTNTTPAEYGRKNGRLVYSIKVPVMPIPADGHIIINHHGTEKTEFEYVNRIPSVSSKSLEEHLTRHDHASGHKSVRYLERKSY